MIKLIGTEYKFEDESMIVYEGGGFTMSREFHTPDAPNGEHFGGLWVIRNSNNEVVDYDGFRLILANRNGMELVRTQWMEIVMKAEAHASESGHYFMEESDLDIF